MSNLKSRLKLIGLFGLFCLLAVNAMADTSYTVNMVATGQVIFNGTNPPTGGNIWPNTGYCYSLIPGQGNAAVTGTLTLLSAGGLTLSFGTGIGSANGCGASFTSPATNLATVPAGTYTQINTGKMCNDANCNNPDHAVAGFIPTATGTYFLVSDQYPIPTPAGCPGTGVCENGGSLVYILKVAGTTTTQVPEPSSVVLLSTMLLGVGMLLRRRLAHN